MIELLKTSIELGEFFLFHLEKGSEEYINLYIEIDKSKKRLKDLMQVKPQ